MLANKNINKACRYILFHDADVIVSFIGLLLISGGFIYFLAKGIFENRGDDFILMILYVLLVGSFLLISNAMIVSLTIKDRLTKRIEFILGSGISLKEYIKAYAIEMWRISSFSGYLLFIFSYVFYDFKFSYISFIIVFLITIIMLYFEVLLMNLIGLTLKNYKFFKNILFFTTSFSIYLLGTFSKTIITFLTLNNISLLYLIIGINLTFMIIFSCGSYLMLKNKNLEDIISREGVWS